MSSQHLHMETLRRLVELKAPRAEAASAMTHLAHCKRCKDELLRLFPEPGRALLQRFQLADDQPSLEALQSGDMSLSTPQIMNQLRKFTVAHRALWVRNSKRCQDITLVPEFLSEAGQLWCVDPRSAEEWIRLASVVLGRISSQGSPAYPKELLADYWGRTWGYLGNTLRIYSSFSDADRAFRTSKSWLARGTRDPDEEATLARFQGTSARAQLRSGEAEYQLRQARSHFRDRGNVREAASIEVGLALNRDRAGDLETATRILESLLSHHSSGTIGRLAYVKTLQVYAFTQNKLGNAESATATFSEARRLARAPKNSVEAARCDWQHALLMQRQGHLETAEALLRRASELLYSTHMEADAALASLDLATVLLDLGKRTEVQELATDSYRVLGVSGIPRDLHRVKQLLRAASP